MTSEANYVRAATPEDIDGIHELIRELAIFERSEEEFILSKEQLLADFSRNKYKAFVAVNADGEMAGMAFIYPVYSTWKGECWYLEDIIVKEKYRRNKIGTALFEQVISFVKSTGAHRLRWQVLDWNEPAISFYKKYNSVFETEWLTCKLTGEQLQADV